MAEEAVISDDAAALEADTENDLQILADESVTAALPEAEAADDLTAVELTDEEVLEEADAQEETADVAALADDQSGETDLELPTENLDEALTLDAASYPVMALDKEYTISADNGIVYYQFTPKADGVYKVYSYDKESGDPYVYLYDGEDFDPENRDELSANDDSDYDNNFSLKYSMDSGKTYVYGFSALSSSSSFEYKVKLIEVEDVDVTFYLNNPDAFFEDDTDSKTVSYEIGSSISSDRYVGYYEYEGDLQFAGWSTDPEAAAPDEDIKASKDLKLYAVWKAERKVTAHANHEDAYYDGYYDENLNWVYDKEGKSTTEKFIETQKLWEMDEDGSTASRLNTPRYNYNTMSFKGWSTNPNATEPDALIVVGDKDMDVYAVWEQKYKVTFHANNENAYYRDEHWDEEKEDYVVEEASEYSYYYRTGDEIQTENSGWYNTPQRKNESIIFKGWSTNKKATAPDKEIVVGTSELHLYAVWAEAAKVTFNLNNTDESVYSEQYNYESGEYEKATEKFDRYIEKGSSFYKRDYSPYYDGNRFNFIGWSTDKNATRVDNYIDITDDTVLYGIWLNRYTVTMDANGGYFYDEPENTKYSYSVNEGTAFENENITINNTDTDKAFAGWFDKKTGGTQYTSASKINSNVTLYARWVDVKTEEIKSNENKTAKSDVNKLVYKFVPTDSGLYAFNSADTKGYDPSVVLYDSNMKELASNDDGSNRSNFLLTYNMEKGKTYYYSVSNSTTGAFSYKVKVEKVKAVNITLDANLEGANVSDGKKNLGDKTDPISVAAGLTTLRYIAEPGNNNKIFAGWSTNKNGTYGSYYVSATEDTTFYAVWNDAITVTFNANNKDAYFGDDDSKAPTYEAKFAAGASIGKYSGQTPSTSNQNLVFLGWSTNPKATEPDEEIEVKAGIAPLYAVWRENSSSEAKTLTVNKTEKVTGVAYSEAILNFTAPEDGLYVFTSLDIKDGDPFAKLYYDPEDDPYWWNSDYDGGEGTNFLITADMNKNETHQLRVRSEWEEDDYDFSVRVFKAEPASVTFDLNTDISKAYYRDNGKKTSTINRNNSNYYVGGTLNSWYSPEYQDEAMELVGWSTKKDAKEPDEQITLTKSMTVYAVWKDRIKITFDVNTKLEDAFLRYYDDSRDSYVNSDKRTMQFEKGGTMWSSDYRPTVKNKAKKFLGWSTKKDAKTVDSSELVLDKDTTLYAIWGDLATVTYHANGGYFSNQGVITAEDIVIGETFYSPNTPQNTVPSKVFAGWAKTATAKEPDVDEDTVINGDMDVYAVWKDGIKITIDANGGYFNLAYGEKATKNVIYVLPGTTVGDVPMYGYVRALNNDPYKADSGRRSLTKGGKEDDGTTKLTKATTLYVVWIDLVDVVFDANGGTILEEKSVTEKWAKGTTSNISYSWQAKSSETGKVFAGWSLDKKTIVTTVTANKKVTLYAIYHDGFKVTLKSADKNESFSGRVNATNINEDNNTFIWPKNVPYSNMNLYVEPNSDYLPIGFSTTTKEANLISDSWYPTKDTTLYAIAAKGWYIRFYAGEGTFAVQDNNSGYSVKYRNVEVRDGNTINTVMETPIAPEGKAFKAWKRSDTGAEVSSADAAKIKPTKAITLTAVYEKAVAVTGISLNKKTTTLSVGGSETLKATVNPAKASQIVSWSSSNTSVATVNVSGKVTAVKAGTAKIRATAAGGKYAECTVTVTGSGAKVAVTGIKLDKTTANVGIDKTLTLKATVSPSNATNKKVTWKSSNDKVAKVDANGKVTGIAKGVATITATTDDGKKTATCKVTSLFSDVMDSSAYYFAPVYWAAQKGITNGYMTAADKKTGLYGQFGHVITCSRAHVVTFLWRLAGKPNPKTKKNPFKDVKSTAYYYKAVLWAAEKGITKGYADGTFKPDAACLREHVVTFLWRYAGKPNPRSISKLNDIKKSDYYYKAVNWAAEKGITKGYTSGKYKGGFGPKLDCQREHVVTFLWRYAGKPGYSIK